MIECVEFVEKNNNQDWSTTQAYQLDKGCQEDQVIVEKQIKTKKEKIVNYITRNTGGVLSGKSFYKALHNNTAKIKIV
jgi:hypothetical protein